MITDAEKKILVYELVLLTPILLLGDLIRSNRFAFQQSERERPESARAVRSPALSLSLSCSKQFHSISCAQVLLVFDWCVQLEIRQMYRGHGTAIRRYHRWERARP